MSKWRDRQNDPSYRAMVEAARKKLDAGLCTKPHCNQADGHEGDHDPEPKCTTEGCRLPANDLDPRYAGLCDFCAWRKWFQGALERFGASHHE